MVSVSSRDFSFYSTYFFLKRLRVTTAIASTLAALAVAHPAYALPQGGIVSGGSAVIVTPGKPPPRRSSVGANQNHSAQAANLVR